MSAGMFNQSSFYGAGIPYVTGTTVAPGQQVAFFFPQVTKRLQIQIADVSGGVGAVRVHFAPSTPNNNVFNNNHYWTVMQTAALKQNFDAETKTNVVYITGQTSAGAGVSVQILATLAPVSSNEWITPLSGTGIDK